MELAPAPKRRKATCFASMSKEDRHDFIKSAATVAIHDGLDYLAAAQKVANQQEIVHIQTIERKAVKQAVYRAANTMKEMHALQAMMDMANATGESHEPDGDKENDDISRANNRQGNSGRPVKPLAMLVPGDKQRAKMSYKGAATHQHYRHVVKEVVLAAVSGSSSSSNSMAHQVIQSLHSQGITLGIRQSTRMVVSYQQKGEAKSPQKPGGVYVPSCIEARIVTLIQGLRQRKMPVFGDDVMGWCTEMIRDTPYERNFPGGKATVGWYRGFLRRTGMTTGTERPLEITRSEWLTEENLRTYYEVAEGPAKCWGGSPQPGLQGNSAFLTVHLHHST